MAENRVPTHEKGYIPLIDNRLRCRVCKEVWPCPAMTEDRVPTTEAGRNTLRQPPGSLDEWRGAILAIEAEASAEGWNRANDAARAAAAEQPAPPLDVQQVVDRIRQRVVQRTNVEEWGRDALIEYGVVMDILDEEARDD